MPKPARKRKMSTDYPDETVEKSYKINMYVTIHP